MVAKIVFLGSLGMILYVYLGYPLLALLLGLVRRRPVQKGETEPTVSVLIAAHNEEQSIAATLRNKLTQDYPADKLEVIVVSDGSADGTDAIVRTINPGRVKLIRQEPRAGKTAALNLAFPVSTGEILVFSDANSLYRPDTIRRLVRNFQDPRVGYVTGRMVYRNPDGSWTGEGCSLYMKYENLLRGIESEIGSIVGVDGGVDAVRRDLYRPMTPDQLPDFVLPLSVVVQGYRVVYEPQALLMEDALQSSADEYAMRVRVSLRAFWGLKDMRSLLNPAGHPLFAWQLWSHKVLRYLCFLFMIGAYLANVPLWSQGRLYQALFVLQNAFYAGALLSSALGRRGLSFRPLYLANYFVLLNLSSAHAFGKFLTGKKQVLWQPRKGH
jgi:cellulose synthase/poly-beta-1,6-N-acetylglucosamine synthase-like glycosyltransferase